MVPLLVRLPDVQRYSSLPSPQLQLPRLGLFLSVLQTHSLLVLLRARANFSDCGFFKEGFSVLGRSFPFPSLLGFFLHSVRPLLRTV